ncbi:FecR family protein [Prolixibacteraceae bacterium JC049]|nr:FecR family protein [Prolixibacteraceae bacterium JC049]
MKRDDKLHLLSNELIQNKIINLKKHNSDAKRELLKLYEGDCSQLKDDLKLLSYLKFKKNTVSDKEVVNEWSRLDKRIRKKNLISPSIFWLWSQRIAVVLVLPLIFATIYYFQQSLYYEEKVTNVEAINHTVYAPLGGKTKVDLPDGSRVWLNAGSELTYPQKFNDNQRELKLIGEGYFEVMKMKIPMIVHTADLDIKVLGTKFNLSAYANNDIVETQLLTGKVAVAVSEQNYELKPGEVARFNKKTGNMLINRIEQKAFVAGWRNNLFSFDDEAFAEIIRDIERSYNVTIRLLDPEIGQYKFNGTISSKSIDQVMKIFAYSLPITYHKEEIRTDDGIIKEQISIRKDRKRTIKY